MNTQAPLYLLQRVTLECVKIVDGELMYVTKSESVPLQERIDELRRLEGET